jgi:hypothetical protein
VILEGFLWAFGETVGVVAALLLVLPLLVRRWDQVRRPSD